MRDYFSFAAMLAVALFPGVVMTARSQSPGKIGLIQMNNASITTAIENLARQSGRNFLIDPKLFGNGIPEPTVTFAWTNVSADDALARLLKEHDLVLVEDKFTTIALITGTNHVASVVDASLLGGDTNPASQMTNAPGLLIQFDMAPLDQALKNLIAHDHLDIVLDPKVSDYVDASDPTIHKFHNAPLVSVRWQNVNPRQGIVALCETYDLAIVKDAATGGVQIKPKD
jgi:hypothetical protein